MKMREANFENRTPRQKNEMSTVQTKEPMIVSIMAAVQPLRSHSPRFSATASLHNFALLLLPAF
jgi:hypothetical protein